MQSSEMVSKMGPPKAQNNSIQFCEILTLIRYFVISLPAISSRLVRWGRAKPSYTGQICVTPSPESTTTPVSKPVTKQFKSHNTQNNTSTRCTMHKSYH